jgi:hypothetical protein
MHLQVTCVGIMEDLTDVVDQALDGLREYLPPWV